MDLISFLIISFCLGIISLWLSILDEIEKRKPAPPVRTLFDLVPFFYKLAIASRGINIAEKNLALAAKGLNKRRKRK